MCAALSLSCAACASGNNDKSDQPGNEESGENMQIPNPFVEYATLKDAEKAAGFVISVPENIDGKEISRIEVMDGKMIQVRYGDDLEICIRKQAGDEDISGDYNEYTSVEEKDGVTLKGDGELLYTAVWVKDSYSYAVMVNEGMSPNGFTSIVDSVD